MNIDVPPVRIALYVCEGVFSFILFVLCCVRLHYTNNLPLGDPLNNGRDFYDPIVVELLVTSLLTMFWAGYIIYVIHRRAERGFLTTFRWEILGLFVLWLMALVGAAIATSGEWHDLSWCWVYAPCRILSALVAFAWITWIVLTGIFVLTTFFTFVNSAVGEPLHGRWDPADRMGRGPGPEMGFRDRT